MKISNETKVAALAIVAIALAIWGYNFIRGKNVLATSNIYYVEYEEVNQLNVSTPVVINGFQVGFVADLYLKPDDPDLVVVKLDLRKEIRVPKDTRALLKSTGIMGGQVIALEYDNMCTEGNCATSGAYLQGQTLGLLDAMVGKDKLESYTGLLKDELADLLDTLNRVYLSEDAEGPLAESLRNMSATLENLQRSSQRFDRLLAASAQDVEYAVRNVRLLTDTLAASQGQIAGIISNAEKVSSDLAEADLRQTLTEVKAAVESLNSTLASADQAVGSVAKVAQRLDEGEGTLGKLLADEDLYYRLENISLQADSLITDFHDRPYRYVPFKSRKKVKKYDRKDEGR